eukprot:scaffold5024_cov136-Cylindrotheca_fusiformis.AAC.16
MTAIQHEEHSFPLCFKPKRLALRRRERKPKIEVTHLILWFVTWFVFTNYFCSLWKAFTRSSFRQFASYKNPEVELLKTQFPVHIGKTRESIYHPGFLLSLQENLNVIYADREIPRKLEVPHFWDPSAFGPSGPRAFLVSNDKDLITPGEATQIGSYHDGRETIFAAVASYRDSRCLSTVEDLYSRARYPDRIRIAIVDQRKGDDEACRRSVEECEKDPHLPYCMYRHLIDYIEYNSELMVGPTFARHLTHRMYRGEYFALQIDSHVRFVVDWDEDIIGQWKRTGNEMAVISTYLNNFTEHNIHPQTHKNLNPKLSMMCKSSFDGGGETKHLKFDSQPTAKPQAGGVPMMQPFWAAGFSFARGHFILQVPYDQYLPMVFQGEEISMTVRAWTYGYDFYAPMRNMAFHMYASPQKGRVSKKTNNENLFTENEVMYPGAKLAAYKRLNAIIGITTSSNEEFYKLEIDEYGLGKVRSPEDFYRIFGINPESNSIEPGLCDFVRKRMQTQFEPNLRFDRMGVDYSKIRFEYKAPKRVDAPLNPAEVVKLRATLQQKTGGGRL